MKVDLCTTLINLEKIRVVLNKERGINIKNLSLKTKVPPTTTSFYLYKYLKDRIKVKRIGREKLIFLIGNKKTKEELKLINREKKFKLAEELRKKGLTYSEIKKKIINEGHHMADGQISEKIRNIEIEKNYLKRYKEKIREDRVRAGRIAGKSNVLSGMWKEVQKKGIEKLKEKAMKRIPASSKKLTLNKVRVIGHCLFDGSVSKTKNRFYAVQYTNKSKSLINNFKKIMEEVYKLQPSSLIEKEKGIFLIRYFSLAVVLDILKYIKNGIPKEIIDSPVKWKIEFLKTFWNDEGAISWTEYKDIKGYKHSSKRLEAYCENDLIRQQLIKLHEDVGFGVKEYGKKIILSGYENLKNFKKIINFSEGIFLSYPKSRFNGVEKRKVLKEALGDYKRK